jgi:hypothetical protein
LDLDRLESTLLVPESLARVLDMYSPKTTPQGLANYVADQAELGKGYFTHEANAIHYLCAVALALAPPESDHSMDFDRRCETAARSAVSSDYADVLTTLMELGWGGSRLEPLPPGVVVSDPDSEPTVQEVGEHLRYLLLKKTAGLARRLLESWEAAGHITRHGARF